MIRTRNRTLSFVITALLLATGCAAGAEPSSEESTDVAESDLMRGGALGANGDSCTVRTNPDGTTVPGTEKDGECCSNADSKDCVIILKPFPSAFLMR
jgi:hypothetical protein